MRGKRMLCVLCGAVLLLGVSPLLRAQNDVPNKAQVIQQIRMLYYTPTTAGLQSVSCSVAVDWHEILRDAAAGNGVAETDPRLLYLNKVRISITASLDGTSDIEWLGPSGDYPGGAAAMAKLEGGTKKVMASYIQTWAGFLNGTLLPKPTDDFHLAPISDGYQMTVAQNNISIDARLAPDYTIKEYHVKTSAFDVDMFPSFRKTTQGLLFTGYEADYKGAPLSGHLTVKSDDQQVGGYYVPLTFQMVFLNLGQFDFTFKNCTVNGNLPDARVMTGAN